MKLYACVGVCRFLNGCGLGVLFCLAAPVWASPDLNERTERVAISGFEEFGIMVDSRNDFDQFTLPPDLWQPTLAPAPRSSPETATFVSASDRALMYRYAIPDGVDINEPQPVLIRFHGNNSGSQEHMLNIWFNSTASAAEQRGLIPVVVASPETRNPPQEEVRQWMAEDRQLVHEFLQNGLTEHMAVDHDRIYFDGGSQGACFLHDFMQSHGEHYGGGFYGGCGCYNSPDPTWDPPEAFKERMKVYIHNTTGDFLFEAGNRGYAYYKYTIGLDTRGDLDQDGIHCSRNGTQRLVALDWFTGNIDIPEEPFRPHWSRISTQDSIEGLAIDGNQRAWKLVDQAVSESTILYRQTGSAQDWVETAEISGRPQSLVSVGQHLFMVINDRLYRTADGGQNIDAIDPDRRVRHVVVDAEGMLYRDGGVPLQWSPNAGNSWQDFDGFFQLNINRDAVLNISAPRIVARDSMLNPFLSNSERDEMIAMEDTPAGRANSASWDGATLWSIPQASSLQVYRSSDQGQAWQAVTLSDAMAGYSGSSIVRGIHITALGPDRLLVHGGYQSAWLSEDAGKNWQRVLGLETGYSGAIISAHDEMVLFTDGEAVFRLNLDEFPDWLFRDAFEY